MLWYSEKARKCAKKIYEQRKARKERQRNRTWKAGRLVTFVSFDIFKHEHRFVCQMKKLPEHFYVYRCTACKMLNHYHPCMDLRGKMRIKCMRKSDLSCYPHIVKRSIPSLP